MHNTQTHTDIHLHSTYTSNIHTHHTQTHTDIHLHARTETDRQTDRQTDRDRHRQTDRKHHNTHSVQPFPRDWLGVWGWVIKTPGFPELRFWWLVLLWL